MSSLKVDVHSCYGRKVLKVTWKGSLLFSEYFVRALADQPYLFNLSIINECVRVYPPIHALFVYTPATPKNVCIKTRPHSTLSLSFPRSFKSTSSVLHNILLEVARGRRPRHRRVGSRFTVAMTTSRLCNLENLWSQFITVFNDGWLT